ncbi:ubinuclein-1-like [Xenia sp. Carnegie-2017]|uniref:ubinuclein-1-like n=1 Tax=Xenia sp. Carnegie-2017 TaxID=2897299 RepID=UPI001F044FB8|nr:ubinuclein-1-like [Xenia sp. Carnegie-2017]
MEAVNNKDKVENSKTGKSNKDKNKESLSQRFHLELTTSTDRSFPEFSYLDLVGANKSKKKEEEHGECNVDEIKALAKKFEDKYGPKSTTKKVKGIKSDRYQDLVDVTYGYDATDSFVDDSEAYDELVPADWTTEHGGFYINMGELNFRPVLSGDGRKNSDFKEVKKKKTPKKKNKENKEKKLKDGKRLLSSTEKDKSPKKMKPNSDENDVKLLKQKKKNSLNKVSLTSSSEDTQSKPQTNVSVGDMAFQRSTSIKSEKDSINDQHPPVQASSSSPSHSNVQKESDNNSPSVRLPDGLPPSLILSVQKLIEAARKAGGEAGKCKFFNSDVNRILLQIETDSRKLQSRARSAVYDYLALFLPCTKDTLVKRAKNLFMQEQVGRLRDPLLKLRLAIEACMPAQIKNYEEELAKLLEEQALQSQKSSVDAFNQNSEKKEDVVNKEVEADKETEKTGEPTTTPVDGSMPTTPSDEKGKRTVLPKRFIWKDDIRSLLCDVVSIKVELCLMSKSRSTTAEEALKGYLETEVRPLWPKGWMTTRILYRESKQAHAKVTSTVVAKSKKDPKRPKEDEEKRQSSQVTPMIVDLKVSEKSNPAFPVSSSSDDAKVKADYVSTVSLNMSSCEEKSFEAQSGMMLKTDSTKHETDKKSLKKIESFENALGETSNVRVSSEQILTQKSQSEKVTKSQMVSLIQPQINVKMENKASLSESLSVRKTMTTNPNQMTLTLPNQHHTKKPESQKANFPLSMISTQVNSEETSRISQNTQNMKHPKQSKVLSNQDQPSETSEIKHTLNNQINDTLGCNQMQNDDCSLRRLLGNETVLKNDNSSSQSNLHDHVPLQSMVGIQKQNSFNGDSCAEQNSQNNSLAQSPLQTIVQQINSTNVQNLGHTHSTISDDRQNAAIIQNQFESPNRISNQPLSHPQIQRTHGKIHGQTLIQLSHSQYPGQGQLKREDPSHPLAQARTQSPTSPRVLPQSPQGVPAVAYSSPNGRNQVKQAGRLFWIIWTKLVLLVLQRPSIPMKDDHILIQHHLHCRLVRFKMSPNNIKSLLRSMVSNNMTVPSPSSPSTGNRRGSINVSPSPPRSMVSNNMTVPSPSSPSPGNRRASINVSPQLPCFPNRLSSCSLQNISSKTNQDTMRSPRQVYSCMNKVPSSPNMNCQFPMQSSPDSHHRSSHLNTQVTDFMPTSNNRDPQLNTSLLNSLNDISPNRMSPSIPLVGSLSNIQNNGSSLPSNPITIPSIMNLPNNISNNKTLSTVAEFPPAMKAYGGIQRPQLPTQQSMLRNHTSSDNHNRLPSYSSSYRPFS